MKVFNLLKAFLLCLCFLFFFTTNGCSPKGLKRTPLEPLEEQTFSKLGFSMELPKQPKDKYRQYILTVDDFEESFASTHCKGDMSVRMHPIWLGSNFAEPFYVLEIQILRLSPGEFENFKLGQHRQNRSLEFGDLPSDFKITVEETFFREKDGPRTFFRYRRDIKLINGDIVVAGATLAHASNNQENEAEDKEFIKKILNSIKPL